MTRMLTRAQVGSTRRYDMKNQRAHSLHLLRSQNSLVSRDHDELTFLPGTVIKKNEEEENKIHLANGIEKRLVLVISSGNEGSSQLLMLSWSSSH